MSTLAIRRWCDTCDRFTRSVMVGSSEECAEHEEPDDDELGWIDNEDEDDE